MAPNYPFSTPTPPTPHFPTWQSAYEAVLTEADTRTLFKLVEIAEAAVLTRRASLEGSSDHHSERQAMEEALANLRVVKRERLRFF
ncbi:MAG TPA: hypothetical protein VJ999_03425 [Candidatus Sulfotelmatobacter sp.]|nr:hypothetical protein [Candidatus Sulfotelmatobacter sp.]